MVTIDLDATQILAFKRLCSRQNIAIPDERPAFDHTENGDPEDWKHESARARLLFDLGQACPVCGSTDCSESIAYVGATPIHASQHPENQHRTRARY